MRILVAGFSTWKRCTNAGNFDLSFSAGSARRLSKVSNLDILRNLFAGSLFLDFRGFSAGFLSFKAAATEVAGSGINNT